MFRSHSVSPSPTIPSRRHVIGALRCIIVGLDASRVTDGPTLEQVAALCREDGWPVQIEDDAFTGPYNAPSAGPPPWHLYRLTFHTAIGNATAEPHGATLWRFAV